jgi:hypothetical protein
MEDTETEDTETEDTEETVKHKGAEERRRNGEDRFFFSARLRCSVSLC